MEYGEPLHVWGSFYFIGLILLMIALHIYFLKKAQKNSN